MPSTERLHPRSSKAQVVATGLTYNAPVGCVSPHPRNLVSHAIDFLNAKAEKLPQIVVQYGQDAWFKHAVRDVLLKLAENPDDDPPQFLRFSGKDCDLKTIRDELSTVAMFGGRRMVLVEDADEFVSKFRQALEHLFEKPPPNSLLVLDVTSWVKTTRLAKLCDANRLAIDCSPLTAANLVRWLVDEAKRRFGKQLTRDAAALMVELAGTSTGLLDQELCKAAAYVGDRAKISPEDISTLIGGWKADTTWAMIDAVRDGRPGDAIDRLDLLLRSNEPALKLVGGINYVFRKICAAVEISRRGTPLPTALAEAGCRPQELKPVEAFLRRVRRPHADRLLRLLMTIDQGLKGADPLPERHQLESFLLQLGLAEGESGAKNSG